MHMADALLSPQVGGAFWGIAAGTLAVCSRKLKRNPDDSRIPLMGVLGAFVFAAQMINFTIPATGSSGHLGGGLLLAILLGPAAAFLTIASVLVVQALFFADGGLLALGCNIFNLGFFPAFLAYPLIFKPIAGFRPSRKRLFWASLLAALVALQFGSLGVVVQTSLSGISALPFSSFLLVMQPIHLAIGLVEGLVTAVVVGLVWDGQPELLRLSTAHSASPVLRWRKPAVALLSVTILVGCVFSWYASSQPDGLEWSVQQVTGQEELTHPPQSVHAWLASLQDTLAILPDYGFAEGPENDNRLWQARAGTSLSGILGASLALLLAILFGLAARKKPKRS